MQLARGTRTILPIGTGRQRYRWLDIWKIEGEAWLPAWDWPAYREALLRPVDLPAFDPRNRSQRTFRRLLASRAIPSIVLSPGIRRIRPHLLGRVIDHV